MPVATFTAKTEACINETLSFNNTSVNGQDFFWTFGDGGSSLDQAPTHKYTAAGSYEIKLTVTAGSGCASTFTQNIEIKDFPDASFTAAPVCVGNNMTFVNTSQNAATYKWYFGDGGTSDQKDPIHTYASAGTYTVSIVAYSSAGCKDSSTTNVKVNPLPNAGWTMEKLGGRNIRFKSDVTNGTSYTWSFGDGDNGNGTTVEHEYSANGNYQVKLTVIDANGCENSRDSTIKVEFSGIDDPSAGSFPVSVYPNPFSDAANLQYELPGAAMVRISVMDITGKEVAEIYKGQQQAGSHLIPLGGQALNLQPGMYFIRFSAEGYSLTVKSIVKVE